MNICVMLGISLKHPRKARSQSLMLIDSYNRLRTDIIKRLAIDEDRLPLPLSQPDKMRDKKRRPEHPWLT